MRLLHFNQPSVLNKPSWRWCSKRAGIRPVCSRSVDESRNPLKDRQKGQICLETDLKSRKKHFKSAKWQDLHFKVALLNTSGNCWSVVLWHKVLICWFVTVRLSGTGCPFNHRWKEKQGSSKPLDDWARPREQEIRDGLAGTSCLSHKPGCQKMFVILWTWITSPSDNVTVLPHWCRINWNDQDLITVKFRELKAFERWTKFDINCQEAKTGLMCSVFKVLFWGPQLENSHLACIKGNRSFSVTLNYLRADQGSMRTNIHPFCS